MKTNVYDESQSLNVLQHNEASKPTSWKRTAPLKRVSSAERY